MDYNWLTPKARAIHRGEKGWGNVVIEPIRAGELVAAFGGWMVPRAVLETASASRRARSIQVEEDLFLLGGEPLEPGEMLNHACDPNSGLSGSSMLLAMRDIAPGEEIAYDYATSDGGDYDEFDCCCGSPACRGRITGRDWTIPALQARYDGWFSPYLARRILRARIGTAQADTEMLKALPYQRVNEYRTQAEETSAPAGRPGSR